MKRQKFFSPAPCTSEQTHLTFLHLIIFLNKRKISEWLTHEDLSLRCGHTCIFSIFIALGNAREVLGEIWIGKSCLNVINTKSWLWIQTSGTGDVANKTGLIIGSGYVARIQPGKMDVALWTWCPLIEYMNIDCFKWRYGFTNIDCTSIVIMADAENKAVFNIDCTEMKDLLCNQILNSTLIWNRRLNGYRLRSVGTHCAAVQMVWICGHGSTVAWKNGCRYESNPALRYSCFGFFLSGLSFICFCLWHSYLPRSWQEWCVLLALSTGCQWKEHFQLQRQS